MIGSVVGNYRIIEKLGEGGMGVVYKAVDSALDRPVAIKMLRPELSRDAGLMQRFQTEARAQAQLSHANLATLYGFLAHEGNYFMVMEYVEGETFAEMVARRGPVPAAEIVPLFKQALLGLGHAHRHGIIHRDIKPGNLMVNQAGIVKVMDFGIAKVLGGGQLTRTGTQVGTVNYMAPEQIQNRPVDIRTDIYALGVTLYEMASGRVPFEGESDFQVMTDHVNTPPPPPTKFYPYIPQVLSDAILRALAKNPDERFQTVEVFGAAVEGWERPMQSPSAAIASEQEIASLPRVELNERPSAPAATVPAPSAAQTNLKKPLFRLNSILVQVSVGVAAIVAGMALGAFFLRHPNSTEFQPNEMADAQREAPKVGLGPKKDASEEPKPGRQGTSDSRPVRLKRVPAPQEPLSVEPATVRFSGPSQAREIARNVDQAGITSPPSSPATSGGIDTGTDGGDRPGKSSVGGPGEGGGIPGDVFRVGGDVSPPSVLYRVEPAYSDKARRALFLGAVVVISAIVRRDGSIEIRRVVRGLGTELDESAIQALGQWKFRPAMKNGVPVDVLVNIELSFR